MKASRVLVPEGVDNGLTILDTDPDPPVDGFGSDCDYSDEYQDEGGIRLLEDTDIDTTPPGARDCWNSLGYLVDSSEVESESPPTPLSNHDEYDYDYDLELGADQLDPLSTAEKGVGPIHDTPQEGYANLFIFEIKHYSFPSRQLRQAKRSDLDGVETTESGVGGRVRSRVLDPSARKEIERFKKELLGQTHFNPSLPAFVPRTAVFTHTTDSTTTTTITNTNTRTTNPKTKIKTKTKRKERTPVQGLDETGIFQDLLWEEPDQSSTCLLDLDLCEMDAGSGSGAGAGAGAGYRWKGPIRDIETGRPITPYKDDDTPGASHRNSTAASSSSSSQASRPKPTARRGRPFPGSSDTRRHRDVRGGGDSETAAPSEAGNGSLPSATHRVGGMTVEHKASTRSLPSKRPLDRPPRGTANGEHHHPSTASAPSQKTRKHHTARNPRNQESTSPYALLLSKPQARRNIPSHLIQTASPLQRTMLTNWSSTCAESTYQDGILDLLEWLTRSINLQLSRGGGSRADGGRFKVDVFGSVSWGGETGTSGDLDLVVVVRPPILVLRV